MVLLNASSAGSRLGMVGLTLAAVVLFVQAPAERKAAADAPAKAPIDFDRQILPILSNNCFACHGPDEKKRKKKLRLDVREAAIKQGVLVPGKAGESEIIDRVASDDSEQRMPPPRTGKRLTQKQIDLLRRWIDEGARWSKHWAFVKPRRPAPPRVKDPAWGRNPIDAFIAARLEKEGLRPSPEADRTTLLRRVTLDLTGLPPTLAEIDAFLADASPDAYEKVVDRLLASPRYGERMAVDWLDAARFADTHGYHIDSGRDMTRWREWVIGAFNANMPFDRFTIEQLAGDLLPSATLAQKIASGFHRNHMINFEGGAIPEEYHTAYIVDRVNTTATVWLGLTLACAQCHDHKFDPFTQKEYYQLFAFFHNVPENGLDGSKGNAAPFLKTPTAGQLATLTRLSAEIKKVEGRLARPLPEVDATQAFWEKTAAPDKLPPRIRGILAVAAPKRTGRQKAELRDFYRTSVLPEFKALHDRLGKLRRAYADLDRKIPTTMVMQEMDRPRDTYLLVRGQYDKKGMKVRAGVPASLSPLPKNAKPNRLGLAQWLVDPKHPLTARVIVNRYWQTYFGTGLVKTAEDFGVQGERPSHPELLDWLATEFIASGWDVKHIGRLIVTSATYRQSSVARRELLGRDPENRLLARMSRLRLPAEFIRDQALAVSGLFWGKIGGASVSPYQPAGLWEELAYRADGKNWTAQTYVQSKGKDLYRRTMYTFWKRTSPPPTLTTFDAPDRETCTVRRSRTNTPLQALVLMNDPTYVEASRKLAERIMAEAASTADRIAVAFRLVTARRPRTAEVAVLQRVFKGQLGVYRKDRQKALKLLGVGESKRDAKLDVAELAAWTTVASVLLNLDETVTRG
jgi:hypothetical protein